MKRRHGLRRLSGPLALAACLVAGALAPAASHAQPDEHPFEIVPGSFQITPSTYQAGAHEDLTVAFDFAHGESGPLKDKTFNDVKDTVVNLPAGFAGNNTAVPTCTDAQLVNSYAGLVECPIASQVGTITLDLTAAHVMARDTFPLYNMEVTSPGIAAELGFNALGVVTQILPVTVRPGDTGLTITSPSIEDAGEAHDVSVTTWGLPASHSHDAERGRACFEGGVEGVVECKGGGEEARIPVRPFLSNPTSCDTFIASIEADSWEHPEQSTRETTEVGPISGCERVPFDPTIEASPTTNAAESATGLDVSMLIPQGWELPESISTANLRDALVTLPEGMSLNPSAGSGLGSCTEAQLAGERFNSLPGEGCPPESKVGTVEVETPVLKEKAEGAVYVATPFKNPFDSLLALYIVAKVPERGVIVKVAGEVHPDHETGQLTTTFLNNPQVPFNKFNLKFNQGATSPLISPPVCGTYTAFADLTPWSAPLSPHHLTATFPVETGIAGGPCPTGGIPPFHPGLVAGTINNRAGSYSPFYLRLSRQDGEQEITHFSIKLPPGVIGKLAGIPTCPEAGLALARSREHEGGGAEEQASPSCPAASEVGRTIAEAGVGTVLAQAPGKVYLAGPYHGSAISIAAITAAKVGPFDLGTVLIRQALKVNPETGEVSIDATGTDPIPHIISGIPVHARAIRVYVDRPEFVLNPTNCEPTSTASTVLGSGKDFVSDVDDKPVTATSPFQAADCAALPFKPKLALSLKGASRRGGDPAFKAVLTARPGEANIGKAVVTLPHSEFLDNAHIDTVCTRVQFNQGAVPGEKCPGGSLLGKAVAITPILDEPLAGPVFLRSNGGERDLPDLVAALHAREIDFNLVGHVDSVQKKLPSGEVVSSIRNTFETVPDAPVSKFTLALAGGNKGLLKNSTNLCVRPHRAIAQFTGQNGKVHNFKPVVKPSCGKKGKSHHHRSR